MLRERRRVQHMRGQEEVPEVPRALLVLPRVHHSGYLRLLQTNRTEAKGKTKRAHIELHLIIFLLKKLHGDFKKPLYTDSTAIRATGVDPDLASPLGARATPVATPWWPPGRAAEQEGHRSQHAKLFPRKEIRQQVGETGSDPPPSYPPPSSCRCNYMYPSRPEKLPDLTKVAKS